MFKGSVTITRIKKSEKDEPLYIILIEKAIDIILNSDTLVNIICLPKDLKELTVGFCIQQES